MNNQPESDWKLKLRFGKITTSFNHYTILVDGRVHDKTKFSLDFDGPAIMALKIWAESSDEAFSIASDIGPRVGFEVAGRSQVYETDPEEPPEDIPHAYGVNFTSYNEDD